MKETVDVVERTFEQEKKEFALVCKVFEVLCALMTGAFALIAFGVTGIIIALGAEMNDVLVIFINSMVLLSGMVSALNFGRRIFKELKSGETPFRYDIADKVRGAFFALMGCSLLGILIQSISHIFSQHFSDICHYFSVIAVGNIVAGLLLGIMSYVMNYGCKLQQESDETL